MVAVPEHYFLCHSKIIRKSFFLFSQEIKSAVELAAPRTVRGRLKAVNTQFGCDVRPVQIKPGQHPQSTGGMQEQTADEQEPCYAFYINKYWLWHSYIRVPEKGSDVAKLSGGGQLNYDFNHAQD